MNARAHGREQGLSLIELLLGLAITALVMAPLVPMLQTTAAAARITGEQASIESEASFAIERIAARIRATPPSSQLATKASSEWLKPAVYVLDKGVLVEQLNGVSYVLAESVTDFALSAPAADGASPLIGVSLSLAKGDATTSASTTIRMGAQQ